MFHNLISLLYTSQPNTNSNRYVAADFSAFCQFTDPNLYICLRTHTDPQFVHSPNASLSEITRSLTPSQAFEVRFRWTDSHSTHWRFSHRWVSSQSAPLAYETFCFSSGRKNCKSYWPYSSGACRLIFGACSYMTCQYSSALVSVGIHLHAW